ncbi:Tn3 family transposase [Streptosporangium sp. G11]|uniref:DUF4158 domain-containing protein n=1 Tax=Streptosporangium sp. G11 TaxID=3436926 RepID=UPI003EBA9D89
MPAEFLSAEQRAAYASFTEVPSLSDLEKFFFLDSFDRNVIAQSRADSHRLGVAVQIGTVRYKGLFLEDPLAVPWPVVDYLAEQLGIGDASQVKKYAERLKTTYEHAWMIRDAYGYHTFDDTSSWSERQLTRQFRTFLHGRAWTHAEGPVALFEQSVAWLRRAFAEYGRIDKTMHLLSMLDPMDSSYRRSLGKQLSVQESRHRLARKICHGNSGRIRQAYREGQEDQLAALGLVVNAVVLWNSRYLSAIVDQLRAQGVPVKEEDVARLSPLGHAHLNCLGRYAIASSAPDKGLRSLGTATLPKASTASATVVDEDGV